MWVVSKYIINNNVFIAELNNVGNVLKTALELNRIEEPAYGDSALTCSLQAEATARRVDVAECARHRVVVAAG